MFLIFCCLTLESLKQVPSDKNNEVHVNSNLTKQYKPFAAIVLRQDGDHPLHGSQDGSVDDHRPRLVIAIMATRLFERDDNINHHAQNIYTELCLFIRHRINEYLYLLLHILGNLCL